MNTDDFLIEQLVDVGVGKPVLTTEAMARYRDEASHSNCGVVDVLVAHGIITSEAVARAKAVQFGVEFVDLDNLEIPAEVIAAMNAEQTNALKVIPLEKSAGRLRVAIADPSDLDTIDALGFIVDKNIEVRVSSETAIGKALRRYYPLANLTVLETAREA
ncbi:MAG: hypothetical protein Q7S86_04625 [bacterium]|nr:hypothetical protein [bacterium]